MPGRRVTVPQALEGSCSACQWSSIAGRDATGMRYLPYGSSSRRGLGISPPEAIADVRVEWRARAERKTPWTAVP
jgi:hypothetical protein